jgi:hypothetical protein
MKRLIGAAVCVGAVATSATDAHACSYAVVTAQAVAPAEQSKFVQTAAGVPVQVRYPAYHPLHSAQFAVARLHTPELPPLGQGLPADVGTVVETGELAFDVTTGTWNGTANANGWAQTPGEYVWQTSATTVIPASPPKLPGEPFTSCDTPVPFTLTHDGNWTHRFTVLGASAVTAKAAKARDRRAQISGTVAAQYPGKVRLTVRCPGRRARTAFLTPRSGRWSRTVIAERGCRIDASAATRKGWVESATSVRVR